MGTAENEPKKEKDYKDLEKEFEFERKIVHDRPEPQNNAPTKRPPAEKSD